MSLPFYYFVMKIILSDAKSRGEHNETKYSPIGQTTNPFLSGCSGKGMKNEMHKAFWTVVKKTTFLARFVD